MTGGKSIEKMGEPEEIAVPERIYGMKFFEKPCQVFEDRFCRIATLGAHFEKKERVAHHRVFYCLAFGGENLEFHPYVTLQTYPGILCCGALPQERLVKAADLEVDIGIVKFIFGVEKLVEGSYRDSQASGDLLHFDGVESFAFKNPGNLLQYKMAFGLRDLFSDPILDHNPPPLFFPIVYQILLISNEIL